MNIGDSIQETTAGTSTSVVVVSGATPNNRTFAAAVAAGAFAVGATNIPLRVEDDAGNWLTGAFTLTNSTTLTRTAIGASSAAGADVTLAGTVRKVSVVPTSLLVRNFMEKGAAAVTAVASTATSRVYIEESGILKPIALDDLVTALGTAAAALNVAGAISASDIVTLVQDGVNEVRTTVGALAAAVAAINGTPDTTAPTASAAAVANATPLVVNITMSEALNASFVPAASAFTVSGHTVSSVAISGSTINLTCSAAFVNGEAARTVAYTQPGTNNARDVAGNLLANFTGLAITNNVAPAGDTTAPTFASAQVADASPTIIQVTMSETLANIVPVVGSFAVSGGKSVTAASISGAVLSLTCSAAYANGDTITVQYTKPGSGNMIQDAAANLTLSFGPSSVTNNVAAAGPAAYTISGYTGASVKTVYDATSSPVNGSNGKKYIANTDMLTGSYINLFRTVGGAAAPTASMGWGTSSTVAPAEITVAANGGAGGMNNGMVPAAATGTPGIFLPGSYLNIPVGAGTTSWYFWGKASDGTAVCMNPSAPLVVSNA